MIRSQSLIPLDVFELSVSTSPPSFGWCDWLFGRVGSPSDIYDFAQCHPIWLGWFESPPSFLRASSLRPCSPRIYLRSLHRVDLREGCGRSRATSRYHAGLPPYRPSWLRGGLPAVRCSSCTLSLLVASKGSGLRNVLRLVHVLAGFATGFIGLIVILR